MATRYITDPRVTFALPPLTTVHGFGSLLGRGQNPQAGRQDRDLQRFHGKRGPRGTSESISRTHGLRDLGAFGTSV
jgi:hypothetical protein